MPEFRFTHSYTDPGWTPSATHRSGHRERAGVVNGGTHERVGQVFPILGACTLPTIYPLALMFVSSPQSLMFPIIFPYVTFMPLKQLLYFGALTDRTGAKTGGFSRVGGRERAQSHMVDDSVGARATDNMLL